jgi:hypothetical protein
MYVNRLEAAEMKPNIKSVRAVQWLYRAVSLAAALMVHRATNFQDYSYGGSDEMYIEPLDRWPQLYHRRFGEVAFMFDGAVIVGVPPAPCQERVLGNVTDVMFTDNIPC